MKCEDVQIGDVVEFVDERGTIIGRTADKTFLLHGISRHGHDGFCDKLKLQIGTPVKGSSLHRFAMAREFTLIRRAFDFSQPRWAQRSTPPRWCYRCYTPPCASSAPSVRARSVGVTLSQIGRLGGK